MASPLSVMERPKGALKFLAAKLLEALDSGDVSHNDLMTWLSDAICDYGKANGNQYGCYLIDFIGDGESGDVIFRCNGDMKKCPYSIETVNGKVTAQLDDDQIVDVLPHTIYEEEADEDDHYASMEAARLYTPGKIPLCERFISQSERDSMSSSNFAGKGKSFPIKTGRDVKAAVRSMGRAGPDNYDTGTLKRNIIKIAKKLGLASFLPKAWQGGASESADVDAIVAEFSARLTEAGSSSKKGAQSMHDKAVKSGNQKSHDAAVKMGASCPDDCSMGDDDEAEADEALRNTPGELRLIESAASVDTIILNEAARTDYEIKLIAPGKGSSAFYTPEVLKRDGPTVFPAHTKIFLNHATAAEEAARPEGKVEDLAGVTTTAATYNESHAKGPGLYARAKFFPDHAQTVEGKAPFIGMSIRGYGDVAKEAGKPMMREGVPLLAKLTAARSVDVVTEAGAGGMILTEAARAAQTNQGGADDMDAAEFRKLQESNAALLTEVKKMRSERHAQTALQEAAAYLQSARIGAPVQEKVLSVLRGRFALDGGIPMDAAGSAIDVAKVKALAESETKDALEFLKRVDPRLVTGMGAPPPAAGEKPTKESKRALKEARKAEKQSLRDSASRLGFKTKMGRRILEEGRSAFDPNFNARDLGMGGQAGGPSLPMEGM